MTTPALSAIIKCYPEASITVLTSPDGPRLLRGFHPNIKDIWIWNRSGLLAYFNKRKVIKKLSENHFDKIFCFETNIRIAKIFSRYDSEFYWNNITSKTRHCSDIYLDVVKHACPSLSGDFYTYLPVSEDATQKVKDELSSIGISDEDTIIMLHPTFSGYSSSRFASLLSKKYRTQTKHRLWPAAKFTELGVRLSELSLNNHRKPKIIIDLIPDEAELGCKIEKNANGAITLLLEPPNFERYKALIKRADLLVTPNTGPLHVAAAVDTQIVALFSGWNPADCGPFMKPGRFTILRAEDTADPELGLPSISVSSVFDACKKRLLLS
ncbi:MAG: hypothetical protein OEZ15_01825 [Gammaproteobacteria bacterium]|nr:hypothetical protein [Gammaproteobacteria bacterium]